MAMLLPNLGIPIHTIFGIGRNYRAHAEELGNAVPTEPLIFLKPHSSVLFSGGVIRLPKGVGRVDYEGEVVVAIGKGGRAIPAARALEHVLGYGLGIDVTARDLQGEAKKKGQPWTVAKGYDTFCVIGKFIKAMEIDGGRIHFSLSVNGEVRQRGDTAAMERSIPELIAYLSNIFTLAPGDLIFTGTPEGVGPLATGDRVEMQMEGANARFDVRVE